jgi:hypothetical protein
MSMRRCLRLWSGALPRVAYSAALPAELVELLGTLLDKLLVYSPSLMMTCIMPLISDVRARIEAHVIIGVVGHLTPRSATMSVVQPWPLAS